MVRVWVRVSIRFRVGVALVITSSRPGLGKFGVRVRT